MVNLVGDILGHRQILRTNIERESDKEKNLSLNITGFEIKILQDTSQVSWPLSSMETAVELGHLLRSYVTCVLHFARISNDESIMCGEKIMKDGRN